MIKWVILFLLLILASCTTAPSAPCIPVQMPVIVDTVYVVDGDTIHVNVGDEIEKVRLIGVNTPEKGEDGFQEALAYTFYNTVGYKIYMWKDVRDRDQFGRLLRYVTRWDDGQVYFLNLALVEEDFAHPADYPPDTACSAVFWEAYDD